MACRAAVVPGRGRHVRHLLGRLQRAPGRGAAAARAEGGDRGLHDARPLHGRVHWCGGCVFQPMLDWATTMLAYDARPPDPVVVGERWRDLWLARLEGSRPLIETWLGHQRRDGYWLQGSVCGTSRAIRCPVYVVSGWSDWYRNPVFALLEGLDVPRKGLIGPWAHTYPEQAAPGPAIGFLQEALRWWDRWLKGSENGVEASRACGHGSTEPFAPGSHDELPGRWVAEPGWPSANVETRTLTLTADGGLTAGVADGGRTGDPRLADGRPRQRLDLLRRPARRRRARALVHLGAAARADRAARHPSARARFASDRPLALASVRLCDVAPDGVSTLITRGQLNLTHRDGHETPRPLVPGERTRASVRLDAIGRAIPPGHRLRVSVSPTGWPRAWPSPEPVTLTVVAGASYLELPVRLPRPDDARLAAFAEAEGSEPLPLERLESGKAGPCSAATVRAVAPSSRGGKRTATGCQTASSTGQCSEHVLDRRRRAALGERAPASRRSRSPAVTGARASAPAPNSRATRPPSSFRPISPSGKTTERVRARVELRDPPRPCVSSTSMGWPTPFTSRHGCQPRPNENRAKARASTREFNRCDNTARRAILSADTE